MTALVHQIRANGNALRSLASNTCPELLMEIDRLRQLRELQLVELDAEKRRELSLARERSRKQMSELRREQQNEVADFRDYCTQELGRMKQEIKESNHARDSIEVDRIYEEYCEIQSKSGSTGSVRVNARSQQAKWNATLQRSLAANVIASDLRYLMEQAKQQHIELGGTFRRRSKKKKKRKRKRERTRTHRETEKPQTQQSSRKRKKQGVDSVPSAEDRKEIERICDELGIEIPANAFSVRLYGYSKHLHVYQDICEWVTTKSVEQQAEIIAGLRSDKLRSLKTKLRSTGQLGKISEMAHGIRAKLKSLSASFKSEKPDL